MSAVLEKPIDPPGPLREFWQGFTANRGAFIALIVFALIALASLLALLALVTLVLKTAVEWRHARTRT